MSNTWVPESEISVKTEYGYYVLGKKATSNEYNVALALEYEKYNFMFQVWYWGGRHIIGGQVLDFLVFAPFPIPLQVFGEYWHSGLYATDDNFLLTQIARLIGRPPVIIWGNESNTFEDALNAVRRKL